jgi:alpha-L-fucosidase
MNNRHAEPLPGEDVQGFEQDLPGQNTAGFNTTTVSTLPMEVCMTINDNWGVHGEDENHKSSGHLIRTLVKAASVGANYLLNVGPTALGEILPVHAERLRAVGQWLSLHSKSVYGTRAGVIPPAIDGSYVSTCNGETHYLHVLEYVSDCVTVRDAPVGLTKATLLKDGSQVRSTIRGEDLVITIPPHQRDEADTVIQLER